MSKKSFSLRVSTLKSEPGLSISRCYTTERPENKIYSELQSLHLELEHMSGCDPLSKDISNVKDSGVVWGIFIGRLSVGYLDGCQGPGQWKGWAFGDVFLGNGQPAPLWPSVSSPTHGSLGFWKGRPHAPLPLLPCLHWLGERVASYQSMSPRPET